MPEWIYPETWNVGDDLNAVTLNRRVRDQTAILLRRPMFVAHSGSSSTILQTTDTTVAFDTIDADDDGMSMGATPVTNIYAQREGTYQFWYNVTFSGTGGACPDCQASIWLNGVSAARRWDYQAVGPTTNGQNLSRSITGTVFLNVGEFINCHTYQSSAATMTIPAVNNTPRIAVMWLGIT